MGEPLCRSAMALAPSASRYRQLSYEAAAMYKAFAIVEANIAIVGYSTQSQYGHEKASEQYQVLRGIPFGGFRCGSTLKRNDIGFHSFVRRFLFFRHLNGECPYEVGVGWR